MARPPIELALFDSMDPKRTLSASILEFDARLRQERFFGKNIRPHKKRRSKISATVVGVKPVRHLPKLGDGHRNGPIGVFGETRRRLNSTEPQSAVAARDEEHIAAACL